MPRLNLSSPLSRLKGKLRLTFIASIFIIAFFPIPHIREVEEELVKTLEINTYLSDGESLSEIWNLRGVNIVRVNISCTTDILVHLIDKKALKGREYKGLLARVSKVHEYDYRVILLASWRSRSLILHGSEMVQHFTAYVEAYRHIASLEAYGCHGGGHHNCARYEGRGGHPVKA